MSLTNLNTYGIILSMAKKVVNFPVPLKMAIAHILSVPHTEIDEAITIVRLKNGFIQILDHDASLEFEMIASKILDYDIKTNMDLLTYGKET